MKSAFSVDQKFKNAPNSWSKWKGAEWKLGRSTHVLYSPGTDTGSNDPGPPFIGRSAQRLHPKQRPKLPRPIRHWRQTLTAPLRTSRVQFTGSSNTNRRGIGVPNEHIKIGASNIIFKNRDSGPDGRIPAVDRQVYIEMCKNNIINTLSGEVSGWTPASTEPAIIKARCNKPAYDKYRVDPYHNDYRSYLRARGKSYATNEVNNGIEVYCYGKTGQLAPINSDIANYRKLRTVTPVSKPIFRKENWSSSTGNENYVLPTVYRPGIIGGVPSGALTYARASDTKRYGGKGVFPNSDWKTPHTKVTPCVNKTNWKPGNKTLCFRLLKPNARLQRSYKQLN